MPWVLGLVPKAWQFRVISQFLTKRNFKAGSWISKQEFAQKRRIPRSYCNGSRDRSNQLAEGSHQSKINCGKRFLWLLDLMMAAELKWCYDIAYWVYEITERRAVTRQKGRTTLTPSGRLKNVFCGRHLGLVQEETLVVFYTRMPRETVRDNVGWSGDTQEILT